MQRLRMLARYCEFEDEKDHILDQLIDKGENSSLKKKLLEDKEMSLDKALELARVMETVESQMREFQKEPMINAVSTRGNRCGNCGLDHKSRNCSAMGKTCHSCGMSGHFSRCCKKKSKRVANLEVEKTSDDESDSDYKW